MNFEGESGFGSMRFVEALPGIMVSFNEFRMAGYLSAFATSRDVLCVDWCKEGRIEQPMPNGSYAYVSSGDLKIDEMCIRDSPCTEATTRRQAIHIPS